jgi:hypothetical protein
MLKSQIEEIKFLSGDYDGEAGYLITLKSGFSFDPMANDDVTFIPVNDYKEFLKSACVYKLF